MKLNTIKIITNGAIQYIIFKAEVIGYAIFILQQLYVYIKIAQSKLAYNNN